MTGLYPPALRDLIGGPLRHLVEVTVTPAGSYTRPLAVSDVSVTFSEDWAPHIQADIDLPTPDPALLDLLDPRTGARLGISVGYELPDRSRHLLPLADLGLRARPNARPANTLTLRAASDEARAQDFRKRRAGDIPALTGINELVGWAASWALSPASPVMVSDFPPGHAPAAVADLDIPVGTDLWAPVADAANKAGVWVHCDGARTWRIRARPEAGSPVHHLATGPGGTIVAAATDLDREGWANYVILEYTDPTGATAHGRAQVTAGDLAPAAAGYKMHFEKRDAIATQAQADAAAATVLRNLVTRGRSMTLTAVAAYWLRPGDTITVQLPTGPTETQIVRAVTFTPLSGLMTVTTRQPTNAVIGAGE